MHAGYDEYIDEAMPLVPDEEGTEVVVMCRQQHAQACVGAWSLKKEQRDAGAGMLGVSYVDALLGCASCRP